ncbi:MAG: ribonuclease R [Pseudomonadota bacterium]|nr:ribonuclease R [Pseudomonadota bacterium]
MKDPFYGSEKKRYKNPIPSREWIIQNLVAFNAPISLEQLKSHLNVKGAEESAAFNKRLGAMVRDGQLLKNRNNDFVLVKQMGLCKGFVHFGKDRQPYLYEEETQKKISISGYQLTELLENDYILARSINDGQAIIIEILSRSLKEIVGRVHSEKGISTIVPLKPCCYTDPILQPTEVKLKAGAVIRTSIVNYPKPGRPVIVEFIDEVSTQNDINHSIETVCHAFGIPFNIKHKTDFDDSISIEGRDDWRHHPFVTIDGEDAKDFDDALFVKKLENEYEVYIAIADVSHYVTPNSDLNEEARDRSTSVYFPGFVVPMLPKVLSNNLCSLVPNQDRYVMGVKLILDLNGRLVSYTLHEAVIHSHARLTYNQVESFIKKQKIIPKAIESSMNAMIELAGKLVEIKHQRGALSFNRQETTPVFNGGEIVDFKNLSALESMKLVEVFMLLANESVATFCEKHKLPCLFRNHGQPDEDKLSGIFQLLNILGIKMPIHKKDINSKQLSKLMEKVHDKVNSNVYDLLMLRALPQAVYSQYCQGHFGLAYQNYLHFTSPIRRYPDLLVHQQIKRLIHGESVEVSNLNQIASHCSYAERRAEQASRWIESELKCKFIQKHLGKRFKGHISSVMNFGVFVTIDEFGIDGLIHISRLPKDYYDFDPDKMSLNGRKNGRSFVLGDQIKIKVFKIDLDNHRIDFLVS